MLYVGDARRSIYTRVTSFPALRPTIIGDVANRTFSPRWDLTLTRLFSRSRVTFPVTVFTRQTIRIRLAQFLGRFVFRVRVCEAMQIGTEKHLRLGRDHLDQPLTWRSLVSLQHASSRDTGARKSSALVVIEPCGWRRRSRTIGVSRSRLQLIQFGFELGAALAAWSCVYDLSWYPKEVEEAVAGKTFSKDSQAVFFRCSWPKTSDSGQ